MRWIVFFLSSIAMAAPCTTANKTCMEKVPMPGERYLLVYRSQPLTERATNVERVFVLVHGLQRDGESYFKSAIDAAKDSHELGRTLVIAPQFHAVDGTCKDKPEAGEVIFACRGWSDGVATKEASLSSFEALDRVLRMVANKDLFPSLKEIVIAGHSAGGQFVQRYAATNRIDGTVIVPLRYVVANPSSYLYLESWRPVDNPGASCPQFNRYKYGLDGLTGYEAETGVAAIKANYPRRAVTYLLGELDTTPEHSMDTTCPAMAQGPNRRQRGMTYFERLNQTFHSSHKILSVPGCGHSGGCMYRSANGRLAVFGK
jgi:pimeloyl-ACP methyl ester carboxylesterase